MNVKATLPSGVDASWPFIRVWDGMGWDWIDVWNGMLDLGIPWYFTKPDVTAIKRVGDLFFASGRNNHPCLGILARSADALQQIGKDNFERISDISVFASEFEIETIEKSPAHRYVNGLVIEGASDLHSLRSFSRLSHLYLRSCVLPDLRLVAEKKELEALALDGCMGANDLSVLKGNSNLRHLDLSGSSEIKISTIPHCPSLTSLRLHTEVTQDDVESLSKKVPNLRRLDCTNGCEIHDVGFVPAFERLNSLAITQSNVVSLKSLQGHVLDALNLYGNDQLEDVNALATLPDLRYLDLSGCDSCEASTSNLGFLEDAANLVKYSPPPTVSDEMVERMLDNKRNLRSITLFSCNEVSHLNFLAKVGGSLHELIITHCERIHDIQALETLPHLVRLQLNMNEHVDQFSPLSQLKAVRDLDLSHNSGLQNLGFVSEMLRLRLLNISWSLVDNLQPLEYLTELVAIDASGCQNLSEISPLESLPRLGYLNLNETALETLNGSEMPPFLERMELEATPIEQMRNLGSAAKLIHLNLASCNQLHNLSTLEHLTFLRELNLAFCTDIDNLPILQTSSSLQKLSLKGMHQLTDLAFLNLQTLQDLDLTGTKIRTLVGISNAPNLRRLNLTSCSSLWNITSVAELKKLTHLSLSGCENITSFTALEHCPSLLDLDLSYTGIDDMRFLSCLDRLRVVNVDGCSNLNDTSPLENFVDRGGIVLA